MTRNHGIPLAFEVAANQTTDRELGQLVSLNADGQVIVPSDASETNYFALVDDLKRASTHQVTDKNAAVTVSGVAKVFVETAANIEAGIAVGVGTTGKGVKVHAGGAEPRFGYALAKPRGDGDFIPVLFLPEQGQGVY